jgi:hypothetical protein
VEAGWESGRRARPSRAAESGSAKAEDGEKSGTLHLRVNQPQLAPGPAALLGWIRFGPCRVIIPYFGPIWFSFFLNSFSEKLAVGKSWL